MRIEEFGNVSRKLLTKFMSIVVDVAGHESELNQFVSSVSQVAMANLLYLLTEESRKLILDIVNKEPSVEKFRAVVDKFTPTEVREAYVGALTLGLNKLKDQYSSNINDEQLQQMNEIIKTVDLNF